MKKSGLCLKNHEKKSSKNFEKKFYKNFLFQNFYSKESFHVAHKVQMKKKSQRKFGEMPTKKRQGIFQNFYSDPR